MKISFSTLACPDFSWTDIYTMAKDLGFGGIEIRGLGEDIFAVNARPFTDERLPKTLDKLRSLGLEIPCLASGCGLKYKEDFDKNMDKAISEKINAPCHRKQDSYCFLISVLCLDIVETFGCKMQVTDTMALCVKVLANRCHCIVDEILSEEGVLP